jgi:hypothetical protein
MPKSRGQLARAATNLGIGVVGLVIVRLIVQAMPIFQDAGWIVRQKLTVVAGAVIVVDAILLSVLVGFAIQVRAYLLGRFAEVPGLGTMAANLLFLITAGIAYTDFKPLIRAWPSIKELYLWTFFVIAVLLLGHIMVLLYQSQRSRGRADSAPTGASRRIRLVPRWLCAESFCVGRRCDKKI